MNNVGDIIDRKEYFNSVATERERWRKKAKYYYKNLQRYIKFIIPEGSSVLEIGCETGELLACLKPKRGVGIDISPKMIEIAKANFPDIDFKVADVESLNIKETFDYVLIGSVLGYVKDIQTAFNELRKVCGPHTKIIILNFNYFWEPIVKVAEKIHLRMKRPSCHWFSPGDIENFLYLANFEIIKKRYHFYVPFYIPLISYLFNKFFPNLPFFNKFSLLQVLIARTMPTVRNKKEITCSVIIPCRNEKGNIEDAAVRMPKMGKQTEIIFIEGHSKDGTLAECNRVKNKYPDRPIKVFVQDGVGKADAVRKGFSKASGDVFMILDADLTVPPEDLPKFFEALTSGKGEFINGSRLVYKMEKHAMQFLNILANKFFSYAFTFLIDQYIKDTLCGTKALWRSDYEKIVANRKYFGDFDPFGDFDLLFGATKLNLKIVEIPVRYKERVYGATQISRFRHGLLLLKMTLFASRRVKFI